MTEYIDMWKHYTDFSGRTSVRGYWMAILINVIICVVLNLLARYVRGFSLLTSLYSLAVFIPGLAIEIRRLRDGGKHWANIFWPVLPIVGFIIFIVKMCAPSVQETVY